MFRLEKLFLYLFIFAIPFQTRIILHQWTEPFNEWTAGFIYLTDVLLGVIFLFWLVRSLKKRAILKLSANDRLLIIFLIISAFSIFNSAVIGLSFYRLIKLTEFVLLFFYLKANLGQGFGLREIASPVAVSGFFQAAIAIIQYLKQGSLGLKVLGESHLGINIAEVAVFTTDIGRKYLRAYGTTPHANVLAAWLLLSIFAFYFLSLQGEKAKTMTVKKYFWWLAYGLMLFGFFFTFSRVVIGVWAVSSLFILWLSREFWVRLKPLFYMTVITCLLFVLLFWPQVKGRIQISLDEEAVTQRIYYNQIAGKIASGHPLGIGLGQFVANLMADFRHYPANFYQPVHNIYLLILSEIGVLGLITFLLFLIMLLLNPGRIRADFNFYPLIFVFSFLLIGFFDHFLWTLEQGSLTLWLVLAVTASRHSAHFEA